MRAALLSVASAALLSLAFAPVGLAPIAWIGLVPWLIAVNTRRTIGAAFLAGWFSGIAFFAINIWWLWTATIPGTVALVLYLSLYWGLAAAIIRGLNVLAPAASPTARGSVAALLLIPIVWTGVEWLRAYLIPGFPWLLLGYSQTPLVAICQIADCTGTPGITFWVVLVNALLTLVILGRQHGRALRWPAVITATVLLVVAGYGLLRLRQDCTYPGPSVMVVQPNHRHLRGGARSVPREVAVDFHLDVTRRALGASPPDLIVWSETVMPPLNREAREVLQTYPAGRFMTDTLGRISELARSARTTIVTGANYVSGWTTVGGVRQATDVRNSAYCFGPDGRQSDIRYDKIELVPFAERVPFGSVPGLHRLMLWLAPPVAAQTLAAGDPRTPAVFALEPRTPDSRPAAARPPAGWRFVTPICLENVYPPYVARLVGSEGKRADFIVNLSNDGWFNPHERWQHWQAVTMRCIENRVPMARSANTGISGFVDSCGRALASLEPGSEGTRVAQLPLDRRISLYSRFGEWFGILCATVTGLAVLRRAIKRPARIAGSTR